MYTPSTTVLLDRGTLPRFESQSRRIRQILQLIQAEVVRQRYSAVTIPDVLTAEVLWGDRSQWPKRWKREVGQLWNKLPKNLVEHTEKRPVWVNEQLVDRIRRKRRNTCPDRCPLHKTDVPHCHWVAFATAELMGLLEHHRVDTLQVLKRPAREYNFGKPVDKDAAAEVKGDWQQGQMRYFHGTSLVYGGATWAQFPASEQRVWQAIFGELTTHGKSSRPDRARLIDRPGCPLLTDDPHVMFAGNFKSKRESGGKGYRVIGQSNRGWLNKSGMDIPNPKQPVSIDNRTVATAFMSALVNLESKFKLTAAGRLAEKWLDGDALLRLASSRSRSEWRSLLDVRLLVYAPENYLDLIQEYFRKRGGFPGSEVNLPLAARIAVSPLKKQEIAAAAKISPSALSEFLSGRRPWPDRVRERLEKVLEGAE